MKSSDVEAALSIYFNDGSKMRFGAPRQAKDPWDAMRKLHVFLDKPYLCFETEDGVVVIPTTSVKYFQFMPKPLGLPEFFIKGTRLIEG